VLGLRACDIATDGGVTTRSARVKDGQVRGRELPLPAWSAISTYPDAADRPLASLDPDARLFPISWQGVRREH
jgi:hypothetical protein